MSRALVALQREDVIGLLVDDGLRDFVTPARRASSIDLMVWTTTIAQPRGFRATAAPKLGEDEPRPESASSDRRPSQLHLAKSEVDLPVPERCFGLRLCSRR